MSNEPYVDPFRSRVRLPKSHYHGNLSVFQDMDGYDNFCALINDGGYTVEVHFNGKLEDEWIVAWPEKRTLMKHVNQGNRIMLTAFEGTVEIFIWRGS